jgi:hypothetical protein
MNSMELEDPRPVLTFEKGCVESAADKIFAAMRAEHFYIRVTPLKRGREQIDLCQDGVPVPLPGIRKWLAAWIDHRFRILDRDTSLRRYLISRLLTFIVYKLPESPQ